jgi:hypothetical protein
MSAKGSQPSGRKVSAQEYLAAVPHVNAAIRTTSAPEGLLVEVPLRRPSYLVPPISWIIPFSSHRRIQLDKLGTAVLELCDGRRTVERIIEKFARDHKLTYREAQLSVSQFLQMLTERGILAIVGLDRKAGRS